MKLADTSVVVDIDRGGVDERVGKLDDEGRHAVSVVTVTELRLGVNKQYQGDGAAREDAINALDRLLARFDVLPIDRPTAAIAADLIQTLRREGRSLGDLHDIYIAATARTNHLPVLTANGEHFDRLPDVQVIEWTDY